MHHSFLLQADHFQFYLEDLAIEHDTSLLWSTSGANQRLEVLDGLIAISTARWGWNTRVTIEKQEQPPAVEDMEEWDVVVEAGIRTISGKVHLTTPEGDDARAPTLAIPAGFYRVRVYYGQLQSVIDELAPQGADTYHLIIWPDKPCSPQTLKEMPTLLS